MHYFIVKSKNIRNNCGQKHTQKQKHSSDIAQMQLRTENKPKNILIYLNVNKLVIIFECRTLEISTSHNECL